MAWPNRTSCAAICMVDPRLVGNDLLLDLGWRKIDLDRDHPLPRRILEVLQNALVARVVGDDEAETGCCIQRDPKSIDRELTTMVRQGMEHDGRVLAGLDDFVEITDASFSDRSGQRPIDPLGLPAHEKEAPDEVGGREVVVTRDRDEWALQIVRHCFDESGLAAAGWTLEQDRKVLVERRLEDLLLTCLLGRSTA